MKTKLSLVLILAMACRLSAQIEVINSGNVGIGTTTPGASLDVQVPGNTLGVRIQNDAATTARLLAISAGNTGWSGGNGIAQFTVGSTSATGKAVSIINNGTGDSLYINHLNASGNGLIVTGGKVGIGTPTPSNDLTVLQKSDGQVMGGVRVYRTNGSSSGVFFQGADNNTYLFNYGGGFKFYVNGAVDAMTIDSGGNVGIGTTTPTFKLQVAGSVRATSFIADAGTYADFVFKPGYQLAPLSEVEAAIQTHGHLPGIPSEVEAKANGIDLNVMSVKLLQKVEELTLHLIAQEKRIQQLEEEKKALRHEVNGLNDR